MSSPSDNRHIPSELRISKQWDSAIEDTVMKAGLGALTAGVASIVLFRKCLVTIETDNLFIV
jgi:hypothetical protein